VRVPAIRLPLNSGGASAATGQGFVLALLLLGHAVAGAYETGPGVAQARQ
jgi:hypothetical protein